MSRRLISVDIVKDGSNWDLLELVLIVLLVLVSPAIIILANKIEAEWPDWFLFFCAILIVYTPVHDAHSSDMFRHLCKLFANGLLEALVITNW